jgi:ADP-heptose:LPS heptosyltransferase
VIAIGNDTGPTHLAAAAGTPTLTLFGDDSDPALCAPRGALVTVLRHHPLADLPVEAVRAAALALASTKTRVGEPP